MGAAMQIVSGTVTNPGAVVTALAANAGDSFTVRSTQMTDDIEMLQAWAFSASAQVLRVRSPRMHDQIQNMRFQYPASQPRPLMPWGCSQVLYSQDPVTVEMAGDASVDLASMVWYYNNLPGINARLHSPSEIKPLVKALTTVEVDVTSSATAGIYGGAVAFNSTFDTLIRNNDYAVLGYQCGTVGGTVGLTGVDTGNLRVGGPLYAQSEVTASWFVMLSQLYGRPCVPVFNAANVAGLIVDVTSQSTATAYKIGFNLAELSSLLPA